METIAPVVLLCNIQVGSLLMVFNLGNWVEKSTKESGVPLKVQDATVIAKLRLLVTRPTQPSRAQGRSASVPRRARHQDGQGGSPRVLRAA